MLGLGVTDPDFSLGLMIADSLETRRLSSLGGVGANPGTDHDCPGLFVSWAIVYAMRLIHAAAIKGNSAYTLMKRKIFIQEETLQLCSNRTVV